MTAKFKKGDKVIYHGAGTNQTMEAMGAIGTVTGDSVYYHEPAPKDSITYVKWDTGPYTTGVTSWYTSNLDLYEEDDE